MKKLLLILIASILFASIGFSQTATVTLPANFNATNGDFANVPITFSDLSTSLVTGLEFHVTFDPAIVTFVQIVNVSVVLTAEGTVDYSLVNGNQINANWLDGDVAGINIPDNTVLWEYQFVCNQGGTSALNFSFVEIIDQNFQAYNYTANNGSITYGPPAASTTWNGTGAWYTPANWSNGYPGKNTDAIIASGVVTVDAAAGFTKNIVVSPGAGVTVNSTKTLNVNGNFTLESDATSTATGSFISNGFLTLTGTFTAKRYLTGSTQHFICSPVYPTTIANLINPANTGYLFSFNEASSSWENPWEPSTTLVQGIGYSVNYDAAETLSLTGVFNNDGTYSPPVSRSGSGWNLVGNPYQAPLDWELGSSGWTTSNIDSTIYIWNGTTYASYNKTGGVATNGGSRYITTFQGFFIHSSTGTPNLGIKKGARTHAGNSTPYLKDEVANLFRINISNGSLAEEAAIWLVDGATNDFDPAFDAYKLFGFNPETPQIYTFLNDIEYTVNGVPFADALTLPVMMKVSHTGNYEISASGMGSFGENYFFTLEDSETGTNYILNQNPVVTLNLTEGVSAERFTLHIYKSSLGIGDDELASAHIYALNKNIYIANCPESDISVFNLSGSRIMTCQVSESTLNTISLNVTPGLYVVRMTTESGTMSSKVYIK